MRLRNRKSVMTVFLSVILTLTAVEYVAITQSNHVVEATKASETTIEIKKNASALYNKLTSLQHALVGYQLTQGAEYKSDGLTIIEDINEISTTVVAQIHEESEKYTEDDVTVIPINRAESVALGLITHLAVVTSEADRWFFDSVDTTETILEEIAVAQQSALKLKGELDAKMAAEVVLIGEHAYHVTTAAFFTFGVTFSLTAFLLWLVFNQNSIHTKNEEKLEKLLFCDPLTHAPNRRAIFDASVNKKIVPDSETFHATCMVDIDSFNTTNDTIGNFNGDDIIKQLVKRMKEFDDNIVSVARFGGDEFIVIYDTKQLDFIHANEEAEKFAERFMTALEKPFNIQNMPFENYALSYGMGVTLSKTGTENDEISRRLKEADIALYNSKSTGRGEWSIFKPSMETFINHQLIVERNVRTAVGSSDIQIKYQPIVKNGKIVGAESILSWTDAETGIVYQHDELVKITERLRLSTQVGHMNLDESCKQLRQWILDEAVDEDFVLSINVSGQQIKDPNFAKSVQEAADTYDLPYSRLRLEVADGVVFNDIKDTLYKLRTMKNLGVIVTLDDFGSGFTSLTHLRLLPVTDIKISEVFSSDVHLSKQSFHLIESLHGICRAVGIGAIVDGVESTAQLHILRDMGFDTFQGHLFGAAVTPNRFIETYLPKNKQENS